MVGGLCFVLYIFKYLCCCLHKVICKTASSYFWQHFYFLQTEKSFPVCRFSAFSASARCLPIYTIYGLPFHFSFHFSAFGTFWLGLEIFLLFAARIVFISISFGIFCNVFARLSSQFMFMQPWMGYRSFEDSHYLQEFQGKNIHYIFSL